MEDGMEFFVQGICLFREIGLDWSEITERFGQYIEVMEGQEIVDEQRRTMLDKIKDMEDGFDEVDLS